MLIVLISIVVVSGIGAFLAAVLVVADRYLSDYGDCTLTINKEKTLSVKGGESLLETLIQHDIFIPSACGGRGTCAYCKLRVLEGGGPVLPTEQPYLDDEERKTGVRLSCQVKIRNDLQVEIPEDIFAVREYTGRCAKITELTHDIREFRFELETPREMDYTPGQYVQLFCPAYDGNEEVYRAYSVSSDPADRHSLETVIRLVPGGICTTWCFEHLKEGDPVKMNGPYGDFQLTDNDAPIVFVAGGSGMAPIKCILHAMQNEDNPRDAVFFFGANRVDELFYTDLMHDFETRLHSFRFVPVVARPEEGAGWQGETGLVTEALQRNLKDAGEREAYLCGSPGMIDAAVNVLVEQGMPEEKIFFDKFA